jgi:hypothetical protein
LRMQRSETLGKSGNKLLLRPPEVALRFGL